LKPPISPKQGFLAITKLHENGGLEHSFNHLLLFIWQLMPRPGVICALQPQPSQAQSISKALQVYQPQTSQLRQSANTGPCQQTMTTFGGMSPLPKETPPDIVNTFNRPRGKIHRQSRMGWDF